MDTDEETPDADDVWIAPPWEPPLAGTEVEHLLGSLSRLRATLRWKTGQLDEVGLAHRLEPSALTLGGLLLHLALAEDHIFATKLRGEDIGGTWRAMGHDGSDDWEFTAASTFTPAELYAVHDAATLRSDERIARALAEGGLDFVAHVDDGNGNHPGLRRLLFDTIEEYARHVGHADVLREAYDGLVGEDPPPDWTA